MARKLILAAVIALCAGSMHALAQMSAGSVEVVEYRHAALNHYFITSNVYEIAALDAAPSTGWTRTGLSFYVFDKVSDLCYGCVPVSRFYGTPGLGPPDSHFFTAFRAEADTLKRPGSGWTYESDAFAAVIQGPDGHCPGSPIAGLPVYRYHRSDAGHRYVLDGSERYAMLLQGGWTEEGVAFCAERTPTFGLQVVRMEFPAQGRLLFGDGCDAIESGGCIAVNNLSIPATPRIFSSTDRLLFGDRSGWPGYDGMKIYAGGSSAAEAAQRAFLQLDPSALSGGMGVHVDTRSKLGPGPYSSVIPIYKVPRYDALTSTDPIVFPWAATRSTQLSIRLQMLVKRVETRGADSHAYGHTSVEFVDTRSSGHVLFNLLAFGTISAGEGAWHDNVTGKTIVGGPFRTGSPYGRNFGAATVATPSGYVNYAYFAVAYAFSILQFEFDVDRDEFARVLQSARIADASLSPDPADYRLVSFLFKNEVVGDGEIGVTLGQYSLELMPRSATYSQQASWR